MEVIDVLSFIVSYFMTAIFILHCKSYSYSETSLKDAILYLLSFIVGLYAMFDYFIIVILCALHIFRYVYKNILTYFIFSSESEVVIVEIPYEKGNVRIVTNLYNTNYEISEENIFSSNGNRKRYNPTRNEKKDLKYLFKEYIFNASTINKDKLVTYDSIIGSIMIVNAKPKYTLNIKEISYEKLKDE